MRGLSLFVLLFCFTFRSTQAGSQEEQTGCFLQITSPLPQPQCQSDARVQILAVGDILLHRQLQVKGYASSFKSIWADALPFIKAADIAYANLEGPVARDLTKGSRLIPNRPKAFDDSVYSSFPLFNYHPDLLKDLIESGFDIVSTANNHSMDRGGKGVDISIDELRKSGLVFTGTRKPVSLDPDYQDWWATIPTQLGTIAWIACTYGLNGFRDPQNRVLNCYEDRQELIDTVEYLASRLEIAAVIVTPHWGVEYSHGSIPRQRNLVKDLLGAGALVIVGAHPHVVGPWAEQETLDQRKYLTIYSTGNFVSGQVGFPRLTSMLAWIELCQTKSKYDPFDTFLTKLSVAQAGYIPTYMNRQSAKGPYLSVISESETATARQAKRLLASLIPQRALKLSQRCDSLTSPNQPSMDLPLQ